MNNHDNLHKIVQITKGIKHLLGMLVKILDEMFKRKEKENGEPTEKTDT